MLHVSMFEGLPAHLLARFKRLPPPSKPNTDSFPRIVTIMKPVCDDLRFNALHRKITETDLEVRLRDMLSQSALAKSGREDPNIITILQRHQSHLTFAQVYHCCLVVFGEKDPHTRWVHERRGTFFYLYANAIFLRSKLTPDDIRTAVSHLQQSADANFYLAMLAVVDLYENGLGSTIAEDLVEALRWRLKIAKLDPSEIPPDPPSCSVALGAVGPLREARKRLQSMKVSVD